MQTVNLAVQPPCTAPKRPLPGYTCALCPSNFYLRHEKRLGKGRFGALCRLFRAATVPPKRPFPKRFLFISHPSAGPAGGPSPSGGRSITVRRSAHHRPVGGPSPSAGRPITVRRSAHHCPQVGPSPSAGRPIIVRRSARHRPQVGPSPSGGTCHRRPIRRDVKRAAATDDLACDTAKPQKNYCSRNRRTVDAYRCWIDSARLLSFALMRLRMDEQLLCEARLKWFGHLCLHTCRQRQTNYKIPL